ncbi:prenyltransferase [Nitrogeniibacter mangrovi]|uniref:Prenyltransferase n=1 Tax=Nitrogeniibacter mangrovi TaxID=2016596 RepID=A0A6C1B2Q5_9RHOO|nr:prenyltransferase [Nitrogeniibacter mangrovi]QID16630.1 prenyltransferase [Nitrogeniibacter mangrovi]
MSRPAEPTLERFGANPLLRYVAATRPAFLSVTLIGSLIGLATAYGSGVVLDPVNAVLTVLFALVAHAGGNVINDYHDAVSGADAANRERLFPFTGGSRFIQNDVLTPAQTARFGYGLLALVIPAGLYLTWQSGPGLIAIGLAGLGVGWAYSAPPLKLMARGLGELGIVAAWLLVIVGTDFVQRGHLSPVPAIAGLSYAMLVANILYINQFPDHQGDAAAGKRTLVVLLGPQVAKWGYLLMAILAYAWLVGMVGTDQLPQKCAAAALTLVLSFRAGRDLLAHAEEPAELAPAIKLTIGAANLHGLALAAALAFARWPGVVS